MKYIDILILIKLMLLKLYVVNNFKKIQPWDPGPNRQRTFSAAFS
jgi:hypothetical protein